MKKLILIPVLLIFLSCSEDVELNSQCQQLSAEFFTVYDPYKAHIDAWYRMVDQGLRQDVYEDRSSYIMDDPQQRYTRLVEFIQDNSDACPDLLRWRRERMEIYR